MHDLRTYLAEQEQKLRLHIEQRDLHQVAALKLEGFVEHAHHLLSLDEAEAPPHAQADGTPIDIAAKRAQKAATETEPQA